MPDVDLLLSLAEIAGVFVGFGALIAVRSTGPRKPYEVAPIRGVLGFGVATIIAALAPVTISRYDLTDHQVLALSSVLVLVAYIGIAYIHRRSPEVRATEPIWREALSRTSAILESVAYVFVVGAPLLALVVIALGLAPQLEAAMYFTVVVLILVQPTWILLSIAFLDLGVSAHGGRGAGSSTGQGAPDDEGGWGGRGGPTDEPSARQTGMSGGFRMLALRVKPNTGASGTGRQRSSSVSSRCCRAAPRRNTPRRPRPWPTPPMGPR